MARIGDPTFIRRLQEILQVHGGLDLPEEIESPLGVVITIPGELLLQKIEAKTLDLPGSEPVGQTFMFQVQLSRTAAAGFFPYLRCHLGPINPQTKRMLQLDLLAFKIEAVAGTMGQAWIDAAGPAGAAPTVPSSHMKSLRVKHTPPSVDLTADTGETTTAADTPSADGTGAITTADRVVERIVGTTTIIEFPQDSFLETLPFVYRLPPTSAHLTGWGVACIGNVVATLLTANFQIVVRERYA